MNVSEKTEPGDPLTVGGYIITPTERIIVMHGVEDKKAWFYGSKQLVSIHVQTTSGSQIVFVNP